MGFVACASETRPDAEPLATVNSVTTVMVFDPAALEKLSRRIKARRELPPPEVQRALRRGAGASLADVAQVVGATRQAVSLWEWASDGHEASNSRPTWRCCGSCETHPVRME
jgi:DNA-binding XRE family transcriptional regulator